MGFLKRIWKGALSLFPGNYLEVWGGVKIFENEFYEQRMHYSSSYIFSNLISGF